MTTKLKEPFRVTVEPEVMLGHDDIYTSWRATVSCDSSWNTDATYYGAIAATPQDALVLMAAHWAAKEGLTLAQLPKEFKPLTYKESKK